MIEEWRPIAGYEDRFEVSNFGRVKSLERKCFSPRAKDGLRLVPEKILVGSKWGPYLCVTLNGPSGKLRRNIQWLVAAAFIGPKPSPELEVCHNDGDHTNNRSDNLRYDTRAGNFSDKIKHGTSNAGECNRLAKLTNEDVLAIRKIGKSVRPAKTAKDFGVSEALIYAVLSGKAWKHLLPEGERHAARQIR